MIFFLASFAAEHICQNMFQKVTELAYIWTDNYVMNYCMQWSVYLWTAEEKYYIFKDKHNKLTLYSILLFSCNTWNTWDFTACNLIWSIALQYFKSCNYYCSFIHDCLTMWCFTQYESIWEKPFFLLLFVL